MKKLARNTLALGTATLIVTAGLSFSATGAEVKTYTSYAEAQFIASTGQLLGSALVDPLGDALENSGARSSVPTTLAGKTGEQYVSGPLDPLKALTVPVGNALDASIGAAGSYANTKNDFSTAASGAVTNKGLIDVGGSSAPPSNATLDLTGSGSSLGALSNVLNVTLDTGAVASTITQKEAASASAGSYKLAGGTLTLQVDALADLNSILGTTLGGVPTSPLLSPSLTLDQATVCNLLFSLPSTLLGSIPLPLNETVCTTLPALGSLEITGLDALTTGLQDVTDDGITFNFVTGEVTVDIAKAFTFLDADKRDINNLPPNTDILAVILPGLVKSVDNIVADVKTNLIDELTQDLAIEGSILGFPLPPLTLTPLTDNGLDDVLDVVFDNVDAILEPVTDQLADVLTPVLVQVQPLVKITVNIPDRYRELVAPRLKADGITAAASKVTSGVSSISALRVQVLTAPGAASALDVLLGNSLVGPNSVTTIEVNQAAAAAAADDDDSDAPADNGDGGSQADSGGPGGGNGNDADTVADADAQADADVTTTLPSTGASNLLPFWLLGIALLLFGGAVLVNERRRLNAQI